MKTGLKIVLMTLALTAFVSRAQAQTYSIDWYKIAGGGGTSTGGTYQVSGTIGQPDASSAMTGGNYSLTGGFWSLIAVMQTAGLPNLTLTFVGPHNVMVSWPNTASCTLQTNNDLNTFELARLQQHQHRQRHEQRDHHATDRESVFQIETIIGHAAI